MVVFVSDLMIYGISSVKGVNMTNYSNIYCHAYGLLRYSNIDQTW